MKAVMIYVFVLSGLCATLAVGATIAGAWWNINGGNAVGAFESAFALAACGGLLGFVGAAALAVSHTIYQGE